MEIVQAKAMQSRLSPYYTGAIDGDFGPVTYAAMFDCAAGRALGPLSLDMGHSADIAFVGADIDTPLRLAHFFAQASHETMAFRYLVELWGPTPGQRAYEGRKDLGNVRPGDGKLYRGRGIFQLTGAANYARYGSRIGVDLAAHPEKAADPGHAVTLACMFWSDHHLNAAADRDDVLAITRAINGGTNGLVERKACLAQLKAVLC